MKHSAFFRTVSPGSKAAVLARFARSEWRARTKGVRFDPLPEPMIRKMPDTVTCLPGLYERDQLDRVVRCGFKRTLEGELEKLDARSFLETPLSEYRLRDAIIAGRQIFTPETRHFFGALPSLASLREVCVQHDRATLLNSEQGLWYFGHWLRDDCAVYEEVQTEPNLLSMQRPHWPDRHVYETAFRQTWTATPLAHVAELTVYRELGFSRDKARRLRLLRARLRAAHPAQGQGKIVYISRARLGAARTMSNADTVESAFAAAGITVVEPGVDGESLVRTLLDATMIITIEGSQASHGVYTLADGGALLILQPPDRFYNPHHEWTRLLGMRYGITIGQMDETGFRIEPDEVFAMIERLMAAPRHVDA